MSNEFVLNAEPRSDLGKGASRRLRHEGKVPAVMYGAGKDPVSITLGHNELAHAVDNEAFFSHILTVNLEGKEESAILKDMQRHPSKPIVMHVDLQRVSATENIRVHVPLHYINEDIAPGVKEGGVVNHGAVEVEVQCLPKNLPEYIEVDLAELDLNGIVHLSDIQLPEGVELMELLHGAGHDQAIASIHMPRGAKEGDEEEDTAADAAEGESEGEGGE